MAEPYLDSIDREVHIGDWIAVAFRSGNRADIRVGQVAGFTDRRKWADDDSDRVPLIQVDWLQKDWGPKRSSIEADLRRFVILRTPYGGMSVQEETS